MAIGTHDLDTIEGPFSYEVRASRTAISHPLYSYSLVSLHFPLSFSLSSLISLYCLPLSPFIPLNFSFYSPHFPSVLPQALPPKDIKFVPLKQVRK